MNINNLTDNQIQTNIETLADKDDLNFQEQKLYSSLLSKREARQAREHLNRMFANMFETKEKAAY